MAEEQGKGIALVILGIVAIIAIVGLVLLFTGAKQPVGEFAVPSVKEYGGAVRGVFDPISRAFPGRAYEWDSGSERELDGLGYTEKGGTVGTYGEDALRKAESRALSENRLAAQVPSVQTTCGGLAVALRDLGYPNFAPYVISVESQNFESQYRASGKAHLCKSQAEMLGTFYDVAGYASEGYGLGYEVGQGSNMGQAYCCRWEGSI